MVSPVQSERRALRTTMRRRRRSLTPQQQRLAAQQLSRRLRRQPAFQRSRRIAVYLASDGEMDVMPLIHAAWEQGKTVYLPVLQPRRTYRLWFVPFNPDTELQLNYFNIPEPRMAGTRPLPAACLDLVLTPLVAFDRLGARLGMGGGYYDRTFAFKQNACSSKPYLVGIAHGCQQVDKLDLQSWDIPLHAIATDEGIITCGPGAARDFYPG